MLPMTEITKIDYPPVVLWVREGLPVFSLSLSLSLSRFVWSRLNDGLKLISHEPRTFGGLNLIPLFQKKMKYKDFWSKQDGRLIIQLCFPFPIVRTWTFLIEKVEKKIFKIKKQKCLLTEKNFGSAQ